MYAIVEIAGQQFKVEKGKKVFVHRLANPEGEQIMFDKVFLTDNEGDVKVGVPVVKDAVVTAKVVSHLKGDKVIVFKKKRRKGYKKKNGHRQFFTELMIEDVTVGKVKKAVKTKKAVVKEPVKEETTVTDNKE